MLVQQMFGKNMKNVASKRLKQSTKKKLVVMHLPMSAHVSIIYLTNVTSTSTLSSFINKIKIKTLQVW